MLRTSRSWSIVLAAVAGLVITGCPRTPDVVSSQRSAHHTLRLASIGDSFTAGFLNGGLIIGGQEASYGRRIATQAGWQAYAQPIVAAPGLGSTRHPSGAPLTALHVRPDGSIGADILPGFDPANPLDAILALLRNAEHPVPYDNLGVPGAFSQEMFTTVDSGSTILIPNPFFDLILRNANLPPGGQTQLEQAVALAPDVLTLWIGSNDVLGGAAGGNPTSLNVFTTLLQPTLNAVVSALASAEIDRVAIANVVNVTATPFFTTVPTGVDAGGTFVPFQSVEGDVERVLLTQSALADPAVAATYLPPPYGTGENTLPSNATLTSAEMELVTGAVSQLNAIIASTAAANGWALVDVAAGLSGLPADPSQLNSLFAWGPTGQNVNSAFSLDGFHPSEKGYAHVANLFIEALNGAYGLGIPPEDVSGVTNATGFEAAPGARRGPGDLFDASGHQALEAMQALLAGGR